MFKVWPRFLQFHQTMLDGCLWGHFVWMTNCLNWLQLQFSASTHQYWKSMLLGSIADLIDLSKSWMSSWESLFLFPLAMSKRSRKKRPVQKERIISSVGKKWCALLTGRETATKYLGAFPVRTQWCWKYLYQKASTAPASWNCSIRMRAKLLLLLVNDTNRCLLWAGQVTPMTR